MGMGEDMYSVLVDQQLRLREFLHRLVSHEEGQDMVEYALLAALISIVAIAIIVLIGPILKTLFQDIINALSN
jgi:pilus assembly protein Flp/PilA